MQKIVGLMAIASKTQQTILWLLQQRGGRRWHKSLQYLFSDKSKQLTQFQFVFHQPTLLKMTKGSELTLLIAGQTQPTAHHSLDEAAIPPRYLLN